MAPKKISGVWKCFEKVYGDKIKCKNGDSVFKDFKNTMKYNLPFWLKQALHFSTYC